MERIKRKNDVAKILVVFILIISVVIILLAISIKSTVFHIILKNLIVSTQNPINTFEVNFTGEKYTEGNYSRNNYIINKLENQSSLKLSNRNLREVFRNDNNTNKSNYYYEEQMPVVVYSKNDLNDNDYDNNNNDGNHDGNDINQYYEYDYPFNKELEISQQYEYNDDDNADGKDYHHQHFYSSPVDNKDSNINNPVNTMNEIPASASGRSLPNNDTYNAYYRQWHYVTTSTVPSASNIFTLAEPYKDQLNTINTKGTNQNNRETSYPVYSDNGYYDYMTGSGDDTSALQSYNYENKHNLKTSTDQGYSQEMPLLSALRTLKTTWDLYQSLVSAWNAMAKPKLSLRKTTTTKMPTIKQAIENCTKIRNNSKKLENLVKLRPFDKNKNAILTNSNRIILNNDATTKMEPHHTINGNTENIDKEEELWRKSRQIENDFHEVSDNYINDINDNEGNHVVEKTRYIKGDPLKGYYDFVVTEGSYKFWAVFQLGTAILIIYSTFAAIYYSKVNPLTSDYDYADYLGAGRSLPMNNLDFTDNDYDDDYNNMEYKSKTTKQSWYNWLQTISSGSFKFLLDAIDKLPVEDDAWTHKIKDDNYNEFKEMK